MFRQLSAPLGVQWEVTPWCNHFCRHCYNFWRRGGLLRLRLTEEELKQAEEIGKEIVKSQIFHVTLTGGEPLGVLKQIFPILMEMREAGVHFSINTNLTLLNNEYIELLKSLGITYVLTSLMSCDEEINNYLAPK